MSNENTRFSSAPGKLFLSGEYAVLGGAPAVVAAVDVRARAWTCGDDNPPGDSPFLEEARKAVAAHLEPVCDAALELPNVRADSSGFSRKGRKLGLGSSAAVTTAAVHALLGAVSAPDRNDRQLVSRLAGAAHKAAQGGRGSGADVAAASLGGVIRFQNGCAESLDESPCVELVAISSGKAASTVDLVRLVEQLEREKQSTHWDLRREMEVVAEQLAEAHRSRDAADVVRLSRRYGQLMERLGRAAGAPIVVPAHRRAMDLAQRLGGAAKPSGAGGGDFAIAVFEDADRAEAFRAEAAEQGLKVEPLRFGAPGVRTEP